MTDHVQPAAQTQKRHQPYCFAAQPAACPGYFAGDVLPCICGPTHSAIEALNRVMVPFAPIGEEDAPTRRERRRTPPFKPRPPAPTGLPFH
jgi:hypothetical protein